MNLKRLKDELNKLSGNFEAVTEETVSRGEEVGFEHHLVIFDKQTKRIIIKFNLNKNQIYRANGTGRYEPNRQSEKDVTLATQ